MAKLQTNLYNSAADKIYSTYRRYLQGNEEPKAAIRLIAEHYQVKPEHILYIIRRYRKENNINTNCMDDQQVYVANRQKTAVQMYFQLTEQRLRPSVIYAKIAQALGTRYGNIVSDIEDYCREHNISRTPTTQQKRNEEHRMAQEAIQLYQLQLDSGATPLEATQYVANKYNRHINWINRLIDNQQP